MEIKSGWLTIADAAEKVGVSPNTIRYWAKFKGLKMEPFCPDFGRETTIVNLADVMALMEKRGKK